MEGCCWAHVKATFNIIYPCVTYTVTGVGRLTETVLSDFNIKPESLIQQSRTGHFCGTQRIAGMIPCVVTAPIAHDYCVFSQPNDCSEVISDAE